MGNRQRYRPIASSGWSNVQLLGPSIELKYAIGATGTVVHLGQVQFDANNIKVAKNCKRLYPSFTPQLALTASVAHCLASRLLCSPFSSSPSTKVSST